MHSLKKVFSREWVWVLILIVLLYGFSYGPIINNFRNAPPDVYYFGTDDYPLDMLGNMALVMEGYNGQWMRTPKSTTVLKGPPVLVKTEYLFIGQAARLLRIDPLLMFYLSRIVISFFYLGVIYYLIRLTIKGSFWRILGFAFVLFGTGIGFSTEESDPMMRLVADAMPFNRFTFAAHHYMLGGMFSLLLMIFFVKTIAPGLNRRYGILTLVCGFIASILFPPAILILTGALFLLILVRMVRKKELLFFVVFVVVVTIPLLYLRLYASQVWDLSAHAILEKLYPYKINFLEYMVTMGPIYIFSWFSLPEILFKKTKISLLLLFWLILHPVFEFFLADYIGLNRVRIFLTPYFVVVSILAAKGLSDITERFFLLKQKVFVTCCVIIIIGISWKPYQINRIRLVNCFCIGPNFSYPKRDLISALFWLRRNTNPQDIVLSDLRSGVLVPAFSGNDVYTSWWFRLSNLPEYINSYAELNLFYFGALSENDTENYLRRNGIRYILLGDDERQMRPDKRDFSFSFLRETARFGSTVVYTVML